MAEREVLGSRYEVLRTVSEGRRASVLQALDRMHDRPVALKVYPVTGEDAEALWAEARVLMSLAPHASLPVVRGDFLTEDGSRYVLVMNWVDGRNLQQVLDDEGDPGLPLHEVIDNLAQVADALDLLHAHEPPIIHGDVKPANIVRASSGRAVLVDFDIASAHARQGRFGTVGYVAPEVAAGEKPGPAADVYGLAATAVTLLNGALPTQGKSQTYSGIDYSEQGQLARVLRNALATDLIKRPHSAGKLVELLRNAGRSEVPSGVVAFLATEVADASRLWDDEPDEMRAATGRLRELRDDVVQAGGGRVVSSMNEGDRSITVFRQASAAALAAVRLHDRVAGEIFPPGVAMRLRAAIAVGEATLVDGVYSGAVVDHLLRLRSIAEPGMTITSEPTAELLVGLVGQEMSIVPLGKVAAPVFPIATSLFALTRPGTESSAVFRSWAVTSARSAELLQAPFAITPTMVMSRRAAAKEALEYPLTLGSLLALGLATIFRIVLADELDMIAVGGIAMSLTATASTGSFGWRYSRSVMEQLTKIADEDRARGLEIHARTLAQEQAESRRRLALGFGSVESSDGREGVRALHALAEELDAMEALVQRTSERPSASVSSLVPHLIDETYRHGMSALSNALELLESAEGPARRRLENGIVDIEARLSSDGYADERERARDQQRHDSNRQLLARQDESRQRARELLFEAERCAAAIAEARLELASVRAGDTQVDIDAVVQRLEQTIRRVREVQEEFRRIGF